MPMRSHHEQVGHIKIRRDLSFFSCEKAQLDQGRGKEETLRPLLHLSLVTFYKAKRRLKSHNIVVLLKGSVRSFPWALCRIIINIAAKLTEYLQGAYKMCL